MDYSSDNSLLVSTAVALGVGLMIGIERERSKGGGPTREIAGVRTFAITSLLGAFSTLLDSSFATGVLALMVGAIAIAHYVRTRDDDPGVTTEVSMLVAFALGALSMKHPAYSAGAAVAVTVLLASRPWLHEAVTSRLSDRELYDGLLLAAAALIVLPLLPDRTVDPWSALNPRKMWLVVVLVMALNAAGYVGLRLWGARTGLMIAGVLGGLVSSVTTHGAMGQRAQAHPGFARAAAAAATLSSVTTAIFLFAVVGAVSAPLAADLAPACAAAAIVPAAYALLLYRRAPDREFLELPFGRPISLRAALIFGAVVSGVLVISASLSRTFGSNAAVASVAAAGFADAHSGAISASMLERSEALSARAAQIAILLSFSTNALAKIIVSAISGPPAYSRLITAGVLGSIAAAWIAWWVTAQP